MHVFDPATGKNLALGANPDTPVEAAAPAADRPAAASGPATSAGSPADSPDLPAQ
jgi:hypothetical protein